MNARFVFLLLLVSISSVSNAETLLCKKFNVGCKTEDQKLKEIRFCKQMANESYIDGLNEALADPSIWQLAGMNSAQDYARMRKSGMESRCLKKI